ncbi:DUF2862 domain-containing protein [Prochlorococcus sp. MIT 1011]|uniref:DUF2862 domain-containing protein n=1 Tax=Prochlorococcus sp. MIT 1011 TaxID=3082520 RepID=UPI0039B3C538
MEVNPLIPIGAKIIVDKSKIEKLLPNKLLDTLPKQINGEIVDYKMTDGMGIGYVLMTEDNIKIWIFNTELNEQTRKEYSLEESNKYYNPQNSNLILGKYKLAYEINGNRNIKTIANPINLINWLIFTMKDIF